MAQAIRFDQDPDADPGVGMFHFDDGKSVYAMDPELAQNLAPQPDARLAQNDAAPNSPGGWDPRLAAAMGFDQRSRADVGPSFNPALEHGAPQAPAAPNPEGLPQRFVTTPEKPPQVSNPPSAPAPKATGMVHLPEGPAAPPEPQRRYLPGSRGGVVPTSQSVEVEGQGAAYSPEEAADREQLNQEYVKAQTAEFARQQQVAQRDALHAGIEAAHARDVADMQAAKIAQQEQDYKTERSHVEREIQDFDKNARVDPQRWFKSKGTFVNIGLAVAQGLAQYGAAITHTSNPLQEMIGQQIQADIAAQEEEIKQGRVGQQNALARLANQLGDINQAKTALSMIQQRAVDNEIKSVASFDQSKQVQSAAQIWLAQNAQQRNLEEKKFRDVSIGKRKETVNAKVVPASGGRLETDEEMLKREARTAGYRKEIAQSNAVVAAGGKDPNRAGGKLSPRLQSTIVAARNARDAIQETADTLGMKRDQRGVYENPTLGSTVAAHIPFSDTKQKVDAARLSLIAEVGKAQTGGVLTENEAHEIKEQLKGASTPGALGAVIRHYDHMMSHVERNVRDVAASAQGGGEDPEDNSDVQPF